MTGRCAMVGGTSSGAGKGWQGRRDATGMRAADQVAPLKAQNMSNIARMVQQVDIRFPLGTTASCLVSIVHLQ